MWFPGGTGSKEPACQCRRQKRHGFDPRGLEDSPGEVNGNPLQYSCLENLMDRGAWRATVHGVTNSRTRLKQLSMHACNALIQESPQAPYPLPHCDDTNRSVLHGRGPSSGHAGTLPSGFQSSEPWEIFCCLYASQSMVFGYNSPNELR